MKDFTATFGERIQGVVSGFDRLVLRGLLRRLCYRQGIEGSCGRTRSCSRITRSM
jgi:hypothetical protein